MKAEDIKKFFQTNTVYKTSVYENRHSKQILLRGWRYKPEEEQYEDDDEDIDNDGDENEDEDADERRW